MMKDRDKNENSQETIRDEILPIAKPANESRETAGVGDDHHAWNIIIPKLDYKSQLKMSQQSQRLAQIVQMNAESDLRKFRREIQENQYM